ncbi:hypothetical protein [Hahella ganghwensis]|nr:hypothetical protein [Hahella ganghwensis]
MIPYRPVTDKKVVCAIVCLAEACIAVNQFVVKAVEILPYHSGEKL